MLIIICLHSSRKMWFFTNNSKPRHIIYHCESYEETSHFVPISDLGDDRRQRNCCLKQRVPDSITNHLFWSNHQWQGESLHITHMPGRAQTPVKATQDRDLMLGSARQRRRLGPPWPGSEVSGQFELGSSTHAAYRATIASNKPFANWARKMEIGHIG